MARSSHTAATAMSFAEGTMTTYSQTLSSVGLALDAPNCQVYDLVVNAILNVLLAVIGMYSTNHTNSF